MVLQGETPQNFPDPFKFGRRGQQWDENKVVRPQSDYQCVQVEVLHSFLEFFCDVSENEGSTVYSKSDQKKTLLLMHILITALILHSYQMGAQACSLLRQAIKISQIQFTALYRFAIFTQHITLCIINRFIACCMRC